MKQMLKQQLREIKENKYLPYPDTNINQIVAEALQNIGSTDQELRDELIYSTLATWIQKAVISNEQLQKLLNALLDDKHLFFKIGERGTDSVFVRSFSMLLIAPILYVNLDREFLSTEDIDVVKEKSILYLEKEIDLRGHVPSKGWAHSLAHASDTIVHLIPYLAKEEQLIILHRIGKKFRTFDYVFHDEEDERAVNAIIRILDNEIISETEFNVWIDDLASVHYDRYEEAYRLKTNIKTLIRSLFFRCQFSNSTAVKVYLPLIADTLKSLDTYYYTEHI
ncbi:DUF2785 domain-containing protein [Alkalihalobacterium chitinilyticum]|uniref:DUF2785 domain-containing protein n=1 Tax=Alkalihalobacterium chitinilyticum TaxID=2980103 RepID=A0ABT5VIW5_9BACI|nr:DUF2785 domain-containing protein [Alkalihalobacterium chitinilyticum]MDE5415399.1 DUF2785 domain-containing protein [Alkalihalobacterium chitinilyticum]